MNVTRPNRTSTKPGGKKRDLTWFIWVLIGSALFWGFALIGAELGYQSGMRAYRNWESVEIARWLNEQFLLGVQDYQAGRFDLARQRFDYILQYDPNFPGAQAQLELALRQLQVTATFAPAPTVNLPTVTATPTPDFRPVEQLYTQARALFDQGDFSGSIDTVINLRRIDLAYRVVEVDGLLYSALRNRGVKKIQEEGNLGGGIYDLAQAERFGPIDATAASLQSLARLYMLGLSFWEVYPEKAVYYFGQVASAAAYLHDGSGWTAKERWRASLVQYGDLLAARGDWCEAQVQYEQALAVRSDDKLQSTMEAARDRCSPPTATLSPLTSTPSATPSTPATTTVVEMTPTPTPPATLTPTQPIVETTPAPVDTPTDTSAPTDTPPPAPSETPTPGA